MGIIEKTMRVSAWMWRNRHEYIDTTTGEINCTLLAEAACEAFSGYDGDEIPEFFFEQAFDTYQENERYASTHREAKD